MSSLSVRVCEADSIIQCYTARVNLTAEASGTLPKLFSEKQGLRRREWGWMGASLSAVHNNTATYHQQQPCRHQIAAVLQLLAVRFYFKTETACALSKLRCCMHLFACNAASRGGAACASQLGVRAEQLDHCVKVCLFNLQQCT